MLLVNFIVPVNNDVHAKTLRDLKTELAEAKKNYNNAQQEKLLTEAQMQKKSSVSSHLHLSRQSRSKSS